MTIDHDVQEWASRWAGESAAFAALMQAVANAEGDIIKAVRCSVPSVRTRDEALMVLSRSLTHSLSDFALAPERAGAFLEFFAAKWSPVGASNDPLNLNANMAPNLKKMLGVSV